MIPYNLVLLEDSYIEYPVSNYFTKQIEKQDIQNQVQHLPGIKACYEYPSTFFFGSDGELIFPEATIQLILRGTHLQIEGDIQKESIYLNKKRLRESSCEWKLGDILLIQKHKLIRQESYLMVVGELDYEVKLNPVLIPEVPFEKYPFYKRSPRIIKRIPTDKIEFKSPPQKATASKASLLQTILPPLGMLAMTVTIGLVIGRGMFLLMSVGGTTMTVIISTIKFFNDKKERKETNIKRKKVYESYLLDRRKEVFYMYEREKESYAYNYPSLETLTDMVHQYSSRIYERNATDEDFLTISIGKQLQPTTFQITTKVDELIIEKDELEEDAQAIKKRYEILEKDKVIDLKKAHLGLVGSKEVLHEQMKIYISQLVTFQSYHDLQIIALYDEKYKDEYEWMRWLPHSRIRALNVLGLIHSERSRDQILNSMNQILKDRKLKLEESKKEARFTPHFLFIIDEPKLIMDHSIMEFLDKEGDQLGFSIIYTSYLRANLPENIGTILLLEHSKEGTLLLEEKELKDEKVTLTHVGNHNLEGIARNLAVLEHVQGAATHIPESITFFELYGVTRPEELKIKQRWQENESHKSLSVPLGVRAVGDIVNLNLHEKEHGPHGLVAGTTGSGKSEIVQSYILSLAVNFHPYEVGFLLIDYKGGGMAGLFKDLPHLLGTITNLDGSESMRAMASIKSELARRQKIFSANEVNHINGYNQLFKEGKVEEPIPHLFIISDEFAELKKEQPEFMKELVSAARIGRSLGVHLILATQKPTGVVDDQIWSNSKFKLALKVQNENDSKEILKTPDAASITQPGRAYLQVGNNEIYELFQSAWSGAIYIQEQEKEVTLDNRVYILNELGQRVLVNQDLSGTKVEQKAKDTQLDVVVTHIKEQFESEPAIEVKRPWFPSLEKKILSPLIGKEASYKEGTMTVPLGLLDIPEEQKQIPYEVDLMKEGNLLYIASSGYGKSVFLTTIAISLALAYEVKDVNFYVLDFGNNALVPLRNLPHTSDYISMDDEERFGKFRRLIQGEMKYRKKCMAQAMAQNFQVYNQTATEKLRTIVVLVDNFDAVKEMGFDMEEYFTKVTRDGAGLGIYFILAATRINGIRSATMNNFKNKIAGFNFEKGEIQGLVGRCVYTLPEVKGRAMVKRGELVSAMQIYTMVPFENEVIYGKRLKELIANIREQHKGIEAPHIPILPEEFTSSMMDQYQKESADLYLGLEKEEVLLCGFERIASPFFIVGEAGKGKTNALKVLLQQVMGQGPIIIFDAKNRGLYEYAQKEGVQYVTGVQTFITYIDELEKEVGTREKKLKEILEVNPMKSPRDVAEELDPYYIFVDDLDDFEALETNATKEIAEMLEKACSLGITLIVTGHVSKLKGADEVTKFIKGANDGLLVSSQGYSNVFTIPMQKDQVEFTEGLLLKNGADRTILIPRA